MKKLFSILISLSILTAAVFSAFTLTACFDDLPPDSTDPTVIHVAASVTPHALILEHVRPQLLEKGFSLHITELGWETQNDVLAGGDVIANFFQHRPFLNTWNTDNSQNLVYAAGIHFEPLGIFPGANALESGRRIIFPSDPTNGTRALNLLKVHGFVNWVGEEGASRNNDLNNWETTTPGVILTPVVAGTLTTQRGDPSTGLAVINGNWAAQANILNIRLHAETNEVGATYTNVIATRAGYQNDERIQALIAVLQTQRVADHINGLSGGAFRANFLDAEGNVL